MKSVYNLARVKGKLSAPTRGPWIEIENNHVPARMERVGPHTGAVD